MWRVIIAVNFHVKGFKAFQSSRMRFEYSEKQIGFSHRNFHNLHLLSKSSPAKTWLSTQNRIFSSTLKVEVLQNRKSLDFDYLKSRQMGWYTYIQNFLNESGFWRREPRLVTYATEISQLRRHQASQQLIRSLSGPLKKILSKHA